MHVVRYHKSRLAKCRLSLKSSYSAWKHFGGLADNWSRVRLVHLACSRWQGLSKTTRARRAASIARSPDMRLRLGLRSLCVRILLQLQQSVWINCTRWTLCDLEFYSIYYAIRRGNKVKNSFLLYIGHFC